MTLRSILAASLLLFPLLASAHNFVDGQRVAPVGVADRGELILDNDKFSYKTGIARSWWEKCESSSTSLVARQQKRKMPT